MNTCDNCGAQVRPTAKFCSECGYKIPEQPAVNVAAKPEAGQMQAPSSHPPQAGVPTPASGVVPTMPFSVEEAQVQPAPPAAAAPASPAAITPPSGLPPIPAASQPPTMVFPADQAQAGSPPAPPPTPPPPTPPAGVPPTMVMPPEAAPGTPPVVSAPPGPPAVAPSVAPPPAPPAAVEPSPQGAPATRMLGEILNQRYRILRKLGEGGMGAVHLAEDTTLFGKQCIVKEMLPYYTTEQEKQEAERFFLREVQMLAGLKHPGIPQVYDHFIEGDHYYYVMEYVEGETLAERAARMGGRLPESEVLEYARQIAEVLHYMHTRPEAVVHRDIKPENLILDQTTNKVKLVDFGLAKAHLGAPVAGQKSAALGTPGYAPPEQYQGKTEPRSDVFALGATMHYLLTGFDPRNAPAPFMFAPVRQIAANVMPQTEALVARMVEVNLVNRPTAVDLMNALKTGHLAPPPVQAGTYQGMAPGLPFQFRSGAFARDVNELAQNCENFWHDGVYHLYLGHFEPWLQAQGRNDLVQASLSIRQRITERDAGLEEFLHVLRPTLAMPVLRLAPAALDFGTVDKESRPTLEIEITNGGRGYLYGAIRPLVPWIRVRPARVGCRAGGKQVIRLDLDATALNVGPLQATILEMQTNGGNCNVSAQLQVTWAPRLKVSATRLNLGEVLFEQQGQQLATTLTLQNSGGGQLDGQIYTQEPWLSIPGDRLFSLASGQSLALQVVANTAAIPALSSVEGVINVQTASGIVPVTVRMGVKKAIYDPLPRALRWGAYLGSMLLAGLAWAYPIALLPRWIFYGVMPFYAMPGFLQNVLGDLSGSLLDVTGLTIEPEIIYAGISLVYLAVFLVIGLIPAFFARQFIRSLDEIETYHSPALPAQMAQWDVNRRFANVVRAGVGLVGFLVAVFNATGPFKGTVWLQVLFALILGTVMGLTLVAPGSAPSLGRRLLAALGLAFFGATMIQEHLPGHPVGWALFGFLVTANLMALAPLRWRWVLSHGRPVLFVGLLAYLGIALGQLITNQYVPSVVSWYGLMPLANIVLVLKHIFSLALGIAAGYVALRVEQPLGALRPGVPRVFWLQLVVSTLAGLVIYLIVRLPLIFFNGGWYRWIVFLVTLLTLGALAWLTLWRKERLENWLVGRAQSRSTAAISAAKPRLSLPKSLEGWLQKVGARFNNWIGSSPLEGLTPSVAFGAAVVALVAMPYLGYVVWSSLRVVLCLLALLVPVAVVVALVIFVSRQAKK